MSRDNSYTFRFHQFHVQLVPLRQILQPCKLRRHLVSMLASCIRVPEHVYVLGAGRSGDQHLRQGARPHEVVDAQRQRRVHVWRRRLDAAALSGRQQRDLTAAHHDGACPIELIQHNTAAE